MFTYPVLPSRKSLITVAASLLSVVLVVPHTVARADSSSLKIRKVASGADNGLDDPARELLRALSERSPAKRKVEPVKRAAVRPAAPAKKVSKPAPVESKRKPVMAAVAVAAAPVKKAAPTVGQENMLTTGARAVQATVDPRETTLEKQLSESEQRNVALEREVSELRSQLVIAETEVSRLSAIVDSRNRASLGKYSVPLSSARKPAPVSRTRHVNPRAPSVSDVALPQGSTNMQVATVSVDKAELRLGPGRNHSALMSVRRGSRLVVETRQGEWYRVFAPSGERAWVAASLVTFGDGASTLNDGSSVRVRGFDSNVEDRAFHRVQGLGR